MSVSPAALQASVTMGSSATLSITVSNSGSALLTFQASTNDSWLTGLESPADVDVAAGASSTVSVQVQCPAPGQLSGSISIAGNDANNPSDTISVNVDCVAPAVQVQVTTPPGTSNGAPGFDAQSILRWNVASTWPQQPDVAYTVSSNNPDVMIADGSGTASLASQIQNNLSYACATPASLTASVTISAGSVLTTVDWQIECFAALEGNVSFDAAELYQGPLAAHIDTNLAVTGLVDRVAGREALLVLQLGHDSAAVPAFSMNVAEPGQSTTLAPVVLAVQTPAETGNGRWATLYSVNIAALHMQADNDLVARIDPDNLIAETDESDNVFTIQMASLDLALMPEFKPVFIPIRAEGREPAPIVTSQYLEATVDLFPIAERTSSVRSVYTYQGGAWDWQTALNELSALWNAEAAADEFYHGVYRQPDNFAGGTTGIGFIGFPVAVSSSLDSPLGNDKTVAHELGHNFGLGHAPGGCNESSPDPDYPYPFGGIGPDGGWLFSEARYIAPESGHFDVMTYCHPQYISDYHYQKVIDTFAIPQMITRPNVSGVWAGSMALSGSVDEYGVWTMTHATQTDKPARAAKPGPFVIVLYRDNGMELYRQTFDSHRTDHTDFAVWAVRVPTPSIPASAVRIWDATGNLLLDEDLSL